MNAHSLRRNAFWLLAGNIGYLASQWALLVVLAKAAGAEVVGGYSYGLAVTAPLMMFAGMRLRLLQATDTRDEFDFSNYLAARIVTVAVSLIALIPLTLLAADTSEIRSVVWWIGIAKALDLFSQTCHGLWQKHQKMHLIAWSRILNGFGTFLCVGIGVALSYTLPQVMFLSAIVSLVVFLAFDLRWVLKILGMSGASRAFTVDKFRRLVPDFNRRKLLSLFAMALPLAIATGLTSIDTNLPRIIIENRLGAAALGVFSGLAYTMLAGATLVDAVGNAVSPTLSGMYARNDVSALKALTYRLMLIGLLVTLVGLVAAVVFGRQIITLIYSTEFAEYPTLLALLIMATGIQFVGTILTFGMVASRNLRSQAYTHAISVVLGFLFYYAGVDAWGLTGAGVAAVAMAVFRASLLWVLWALHLRRVTGAR